MGIVGVIVIVAAAVIIGIILNRKYKWVAMASARKPSPASSPVNPPVTRSARGKLPWAVGDVGLWDDEDPAYCGRCKGVCNTSFSDGHSTECDMCLSKCN